MNIFISVVALVVFAMALVGFMLWSARDYDKDMPGIDDVDVKKNNAQSK